ncbi:MAG: phosphatase PAP2 family protein [Erysipelotrichaceae bacterium]|nr:phosphatase PAP2 family protein [Erysipelotrichaceae bacterium]
MDITAIDFAILDWIQETLKCGFLDHVMPFITYLGSGSCFFIAVALVMLTSRRYRKTAVIMLASIATGYITANLIMKNVFARSRPFWIREDVILLIKGPKDYSFPSGHTVSAFVSATVLFIRERRTGLPAVLLATLIGFSRLYLYVHFPSDVIAGMLVGIAVGTLTNRILDRKLEGLPE